MSDRLICKGYFDDERTVALHFSTDGVRLFRSSKKEVWPFLLINLNLDPRERYRWASIISNTQIQGPQLPASWIMPRSVVAQRPRFVSTSVHRGTRVAVSWSGCLRRSHQVALSSQGASCFDYRGYPGSLKNATPQWAQC